LQDSFGLQYNFSLRDNETSSAVEAPEWLVPQGRPLEELARNHDLCLIKSQNFHDFFYERMADVPTR